jgi:hypothetical protein
MEHDFDQHVPAILKRTLGRDSVDWTRSFVDNGGDSLAVVFFIADLANTLGIELTTEAVLTNSLGQLRLLIAAPESVSTAAARAHDAAWTAALVPRQTTVCGQVPLTANRFSYFARRGRDFEYWNLSPAILRVSSGFSSDALERAVRQVVTHHDGLRLQLSHRDGRWHQRIGEPDELSHLVRVNFRGHSDSADFVRFVEAAIAQVFDGFSFPGALFNVLLVSADRGHRWVVCLIAHHITMDAYSIDVLLRDFDRLYRQASRGQQPLLPPKTTSYLDYARYSTEYWLSRDDVLSFWHELPWNRVRDVPTEFPFARAKNIEAHSTCCVASSSALTEAEFSGHGADANYDFLPVLLAAISRAFGEWTKHDILLIAVLLHGRETFLPAVDLSRTVGYICDFVPILLPCDQPLEAIHHPAQQQVAHARVAGKSYGVHRYLSNDRLRRQRFDSHPEPQLSLNVLPPRSGFEGEPSIGKKTEEFRLPPGTRPTTDRAFLLSGGVYFHADRFCISWDFSDQLLSKRTVDQFAQLCMTHFLALRQHVVARSQRAARAVSPENRDALR